jgi:hypothetical protein
MQLSSTEFQNKKKKIQIFWAFIQVTKDMMQAGLVI